MHRAGVVPSVLALLVPSLVAGCASRKGPIDFEAVIDTAKERVYAAIVFVKPIREEFAAGEKQRQEVFGSGVIISPDGLVVTNHHVAEKAARIDCVLFDREQVPARVLGLDPETDLALLRLERPSGAPPLPFATFAPAGEVVEGQFVMAIGSPFGFTRSISLGVISNSRRYMGFRTLYKYNLWYQTDAEINPGNSGGPLVNTKGEIVGINTLGLMGTGIGFSIPGEVVRDVVARLERDGKVLRAWTGLEFQALKDFQTNTFAASERGVVIVNVEEPSPASEAAVRAGDLLLAVNGAPTDVPFVEDLPALLRRLADLPLDRPAAFRVRRGAEERELAVQPALKSRFEGEDFDCRRWNLTVKEITRFSEPDLFFLHRGGVFVQGVRRPGNAAAAGLARQDIVLTVDREAIRTIEDLRRIYERVVKDRAREKKVLIEVLRGTLKKWVVLDYSRDFDEEG